jgi:hypothetical protein
VYILPSSPSAAEKAASLVIAVNLTPGALDVSTARGTALIVTTISPIPNCPCWLSPHDNMVPEEDNTIVKGYPLVSMKPPADTAMIS